MRILKGAVLSAVLCLLLVAPSFGADTIRIGAILAVTGPASTLGAPEARILEMLVEDINATGGIIGKKVVLVLRDSGGNAEQAASFARQLIDEEKVFAIIGPSTSDETMAIADIAEAGKTILLSCAADGSIAAPPAKYVFKVTPRDGSAESSIIQQLKKMKISKIAVLSGNSVFGKSGKSRLEKLAAENKIRIMVNAVYDESATDLTALASKLKRKKFQAIVNWSMGPVQSVVIRNVRQVGIRAPIFQSHAFGNIQFVVAAGAAAEGVVFPASRIVAADLPVARYDPKPALLAYKKAYEAKYNENVSSFGGYAYDALTLLARAIREAGDNPEKVRLSLENIKGFFGTAGVFSFSPEDHNGLDEAFTMMTVKDGKFVLTDK